MTTAEIKLRQGDWDILNRLNTGTIIYARSVNVPKSTLMRFKGMGLLDRSESGAFSLTRDALEVLTHPPQPPTPSYRRRTDKLIAHVEQLPERGVTRGDIEALLDDDAERGIKTSPNFMPKKGRRRPRKGDSDRPKRTE